MPFSYYRRLTRAQQRIYRQSDEIAAVRLSRPAALHAQVHVLEQALSAEDRRGTQEAANRLLAALAADLGVSPLRVQVQAARPSRTWGELHGLYTPADGGTAAHVSVWMRTAQRHQVVRFRTFFRTLIHELCHHLDYELLGLRDSFHTEGFYKRESSLVHQLLPAGTEDRRRNGD